MSPPKGWIPHNKKPIDEVWLIRQAMTRSSIDIAKELGMNSRTIRTRLTKLGMDISSNGSKFNKGKQRSPDTQWNGKHAPKGKRALPPVFTHHPLDSLSRRRGSDHPRWKGGPKSRPGYFTQQYKEWRQAVFSRDNYTCLSCAQRGGMLHADHLSSWKSAPDRRYDISNGRTLCAKCHRKTPNYGGRALKADLRT